jgi:hopanoid biosynthesis associated protein HpnK
MPRRLIINGDDFGSSREVNEAVILAHRRGILTSASLMVSGGAFEHAVTLAKENPSLAVGLHVTCAHGCPVLPPSEIPHVVDKNGDFPSNPATAGLRYFFCRSARQELFNEIAAQFEKFSRSGLSFSHVDSHCHMHVHPVILDAIIAISARYGVKKARIPADSFFSAAPFLHSLLLSAGYALVFKLLTGRMKRRLKREGFIFPERVYGNLLTGKMSLEYVLSLVKNLPQGAGEIYFHPAMPGSPEHAYEAGQLQRIRELSILIDSDLRSRIDGLGIILSTYFDLEKDL